MSASRRRRARFEIVGDVRDVETVATGRSIRELARLKKVCGGRRWRKLKGIAVVRLPDGSVARAEIHWYEALGVGRKKVMINRFLG